MYNRAAATIFLFLLTYGLSFGQFYEYGTRSESEQNDIDEFGEKLVELAILYSPEYKTATSNSDIAKAQQKITQHNWLDLMSASANINESVIDPPSQDIAPNIYYPRYNFGVRVPFSTFTRLPNEHQIAKKQYEISLLGVEKMESTIRKEVLIAYNNYLLQKDLFDIKTQTTDESKAYLRAKENSFASGEIDLVEYNSATRAYQVDLEKLLTTRKDYLNAKLELEQWIGMRLEEVIVD